MKKTIIGLSLFAFCLTATAQKPIVTWGQESKKESRFGSMVLGDNGEMLKLSYEDKGGMFAVIKTVIPTLTRYDSKFNEVKSNTFPAGEKGVNWDGFLRTKKMICLMTSKYERDGDTKEYAHSFFAQPVNITTLNTEGPQINLGSFNAKRTGFLGLSVNESTVKFVQSKDSSKLLVFALSPYEKKENEKYYIAVYDDNLKKLWEKTIELPYLDKFVAVYDYFITNEGEVGVLFKHYDQEVTKESVRVDGAKVPAYKTKLIIYNNTNAKPVEMIFNLNDKFVHNINLTTDASDNLTMFGTYKIKESGHVNGYFISTIDRKANAVSLKKMEAFPQELIELLDNDDQGSKKEKDPGLQVHFKLRESLQRANGSLDYVLEFYRKIEHTTYSDRYSRTYYTYEYGDIIDINIPKAGKTTFVRIPKMQTSTDFIAASGYESLTYNNKLYFFYNDHRDNIDRDLTKKPTSCSYYGGSSFVVVVVDEKGAFTREELFTNRGQSLTVCTNFCTKLSPNKVSLYAQKIDALSASRDMLGCIEVK